MFDSPNPLPKLPELLFGGVVVVMVAFAVLQMAGLI